MLQGYNRNVAYKGLTVHVQTEDSGLPRTTITTNVFHGGTVVGKLVETYEELLEMLDFTEAVRARMQLQHKAALKALMHGDYDVRLGLAPPITPAELLRKTPLDEFLREIVGDTDPGDNP